LKRTSVTCVLDDLGSGIGDIQALPAVYVYHDIRIAEWDNKESFSRVVVAALELNNPGPIRDVSTVDVDALGLVCVPASKEIDVIMIVNSECLVVAVVAGPCDNPREVVLARALNVEALAIPDGDN